MLVHSRQDMRLGIIGCGDVTHQFMLPAIDRRPDVRVVHVADINESLVRDLGRRRGIAWSTDYTDLLRDPEVDLVYVATPHFLHASMVIDALDAAKHVIVEKPVALSLDDVDRMSAAAKRNDRRLVVDFATQFRDHGELVRRIIDAEAIGKPMAVNLVSMVLKPASYFSSGYSGKSETSWRRRKAEAGGGILIMNMIHAVDYASYLMHSKVRRVYAEYDLFATPDVDVEDYACTLLRFENGAIGSIVCGSHVEGSREISEFSRHYDIIGTEGRVQLRGLSETTIFSRSRGIEAFGLKRGEPNRLAHESTGAKAGVVVRERLLEALTRHIDLGEPFPIEFERGRSSLEVILAAYRSGETHRVQEIAPKRNP